MADDGTTAAGAADDGSHRRRLAAHGAVSRSLALLGDRALYDLVAAAPPTGAGIGGRSALLEVAGTPVFVKRVSLTALERHPDNAGRTANVFGLPAFCQYGIGGPGFGAWRELAVHAMTTGWVLSGANPGFPLLYHWRVLADGPRPLPDDLADVEQIVDFWGGGAAVRRRMEELAGASASLALFLEYVPQNLHQWLGERIAEGGERAEHACRWAEEEIAAALAFMNSRGLLHFDAHFENILTDGRRLYFTDFGLSLSSRFELSPEEADFHDRHRGYDRCYHSMYFARWLATALYGHDADGRTAFVRACARGELPAGLPDGIGSLLRRHAPVAEVMSDFIHALQHASRTTPYPSAELDGLGRAAARG
ncbi:MAG: protein kinase family protein [Streptomyces sp.]|nr:protein kinase family protein [Streptomyces sp.]